jgi:hypothetical protein
VEVEVQDNKVLEILVMAVLAAVVVVEPQQEQQKELVVRDTTLAEMELPL